MSVPSYAEDEFKQRRPCHQLQKINLNQGALVIAASDEEDL
jgi:hypothetical protein